MPAIKTYEAPQLGLRPSETGVEATAGAARRLQGDFSEAAAAQEATGRRFGQDIATAGEVAVKYVEHQEINRGAAAFANLTLAKTKQWDDTVKNADPNDPTVGQKFISDNLEPDLEKFKDGFLTEGGQQFAEHHIEQLRQHMYTKTAADMSSLAGEAAHRNARQTVNSLAAAVYNDPSSIDFALKTLESSTEGVVGSSPNLRGTAAAKVRGDLLQGGKEAIVKSAVMGMINKNPNIDLDAIEKKYGQYITGPEMRTFQKAAQAQAKTDLLRQKQIETYERQQADLAVHAGANKIMSDNVELDPVSGRPMIKPGYFTDALDLVRKYPNAPSAASTAKTLIDWGEAQQNKRAEPVRSNPDVRQDLMSRIGSPDHPTSEIEILRAVVDGKLTHTDAAQMRALQKAVTERPEGESIKRTRDDFFKRYAATIDGAMDMGGHSALGSQKVYDATMDARRQEEELVKQGKSPMLVYDPRSEYFFGRPENIGKYHVSFQEAMDFQKRITESGKTGTPTQVQPGKGDKTPPQFTPPQTWMYSPSRRQYRDPATNKIYDLTGKEVK